MRTLFKNIKELLQVRHEPISFVAGADMNILPTMKNAYLIVQDEIILDFGSMSNCPHSGFDTSIDATGRMILPSWCDSHTHLVYAGNRESEFSDRINGLSYEEIAEKEQAVQAVKDEREALMDARKKEKDSIREVKQREFDERRAKILEDRQRKKDSIDAVRKQKIEDMKKKDND